MQPLPNTPHARLYVPENYSSSLDVRSTEKAIRRIKEFFQTGLAEELNLIRATAPLFIKSGLGINDDLNGTEKPVSFQIRGDNHCKAEIVHSLAKWKRMALQEYGLQPGEGIYTDMNAIRPDEILDNTHSLYVDQWDWEKVITAADRSLEFLKTTVETIYEVIKRTERYVYTLYPQIKPLLPDKITFIHSEDLYSQYPHLSGPERENMVCREYGAVFLIGIGGELANDEPHDGRAPDYDDWTTPTTPGHHGLNGDILIWNPVLQRAYELSSMGIRVNREALLTQLALRNAENRLQYHFHKLLAADELPLSMGGGIGQSRLCMYYLRKAHIGEVQVSLWPDEMHERCGQAGMFLL